MSGIISDPADLDADPAVIEPPLQTTKKLTPRQLIILRLYFQGLKGSDIITRLGSLGFSSSMVYNTINSEAGREVLDRFAGKIFDSIMDVQFDAQVLAPMAMETKLDLMLNAKTETVRNAAASDILDLAGHRITKTPTEAADPIQQKYKDSSIDDLRRQLQAATTSPTKGDTQDGRPTGH